MIRSAAACGRGLAKLSCLRTATVRPEGEKIDIVRAFSTTTWGKNVGQTPLLDLAPLLPPGSLKDGVRVFGKCEFTNPSGSIKDRIVQHILEDAEKSGKISKGDTIVAASSGNTAASLAMFCAIRGYKCLLITNRKTSQEKLDQLSAYGAEVMITASGVPADDPEHYQNVELRLCEENPSYFGLNQYDNPLNPDAYFRTLGPEIWADTHGEVSHFVAAGSTGGTLSGTAKFLKMMNPDIQAVMPDPMGSIFYDMWKSNTLVAPGKFEVEGVGKDSIPGALDLDLIDAMPRFTDNEAFQTCRKMAQTMGVMVGGSAGGNAFAACQLAKSLDEPACVVTILCDSGVKYLSKIFNDDWMTEKGFCENDDCTFDHFQVGSKGDTSIL
jgi:cysteine synthase